MAQNLQDAKTMAKLFDISVRRLEQLTYEGILMPVQTRPRKYDLVPTFQAYLRYLKEIAYGKEKKKSSKELEEKKLAAEVSYKEAKAAIVKNQLAEQKRQLHRAEDIKAIVSNNIMTIRGMLLALPGKLALDCAQEENPMKVSEIVKKEVNNILNDLSEYDYNSEAYKERVMQRYGLTGEVDENETNE